MVTLNVYFNSVHRHDELEMLVSSKAPLVFSVTPKRFAQSEGVAKYPDWFVELIREAVKNPDVVLAQRGFSHKCRYVHSRVDPWHENDCLYHISFDDSERQKDLMCMGIDAVLKAVGKVPDAYAPPNHIFNSATLSVANELGYKFFMDQANIKLAAYRHGRLVVVPENEVFEPNSDHYYVHYDHIEGKSKDNNKFSEKERQAYARLFPSLQPLSAIIPVDEPMHRLFLNGLIKRKNKLLRDVKNLRR